MVGVTEARQRLTEILDQVLAGEHVVVTRRGEPIAEIVPVEPDEEAEIEPLGLVAFVGAMAGRRALLETVAWIVSMRSVARDREPPGIA
jgi:prevent-host-death family protein